MKVGDFFISVGISIGILVLSIFLEYISIAILNPEDLTITLNQVPSIHFDLLLVSASLLFGIMVSNEKVTRNKINWPIGGLFIILILILTSFIIAKVSQDTTIQNWCSIWIPNILGLISISWTVFSLKSALNE